RPGREGRSPTPPGAGGVQPADEGAGDAAVRVGPARPGDNAVPGRPAADARGVDAGVPRLRPDGAEEEGMTTAEQIVALLTETGETDARAAVRVKARELIALYQSYFG